MWSTTTVTSEIFYITAQAINVHSKSTYSLDDAHQVWDHIYTCWIVGKFGEYLQSSEWILQRLLVVDSSVVKNFAACRFRCIYIINLQLVSSYVYI